MAIFNREKRRGWQLAISLACPRCYGRLQGDMEFVWCKAFDCDFHCSWEAIDDEPHTFNRNATYSHDYLGSLHQIKENKVIIIFQGERGKKFEIVRRAEWKE